MSNILETIVAHKRKEVAKRRELYPVKLLEQTGDLDEIVVVEPDGEAARAFADLADELVARGVKHAGTGYIESTLARGAMLLKDLGLSQDDASELVEALRRDNYRLIRSAWPDVEARG